MKVVKENGTNRIYNMYYEDLKDEPLYILDSNILVNIEKIFYQPDRMKKDKKESILELHKHIKNNNIKVDYGHGLAELSINMQTSELEKSEYYNTRRAVEKVLRMTPKKLKNYSEHKISEQQEYHEENEERIVNSIKNTFYNTSRFTVQSYLPLLKFFQLLSTYGMKKKEKVFNEVLDFMHTTVGAVSLYEVSAISYYLFTSGGESDYSEALMKVNKKLDVVLKAWNVCWDMSLLRYINTISGRQKSGEVIDVVGNHVLITNDKALANLAEALRTDSNFHFNGKYVPNASIDDEKISKRYRDFYIKKHSEYMTEEKVNQRKTTLENADPLSFNRNLIEKAMNLTKEIMES